MRFLSEDFYGPKLDLNERLVKHPAATFFFRSGEDGLLIVDRSLVPQEGTLVVATVDGELCLRRFRRVEATASEDFQVWGVVTYIIRKADDELETRSSNFETSLKF